MKYEIAYISGSGNTEKLAYGIADCLPPADTFVTDLSCEELTDQADTYLIGFGMKHSAIPLIIMDILERLEGKTILFFVTASVKPTEMHIKDIEHKLEPFMPDDCDYRGLYLCSGQVSQGTLEKLRAVAEQDKDNEQAMMALEACRHTIGHPNREDVQAACGFVKTKLGIG